MIVSPKGKSKSPKENQAAVSKKGEMDDVWPRNVHHNDTKKANVS